MGATAAQARLGAQMRVTRDHGRLLPFRNDLQATVTLHPSAILRSHTEEQRKAQMDEFVEDLKVVAKLLQR